MSAICGNRSAGESSARHRLEGAHMTGTRRGTIGLTVAALALSTALMAPTSALGATRHQAAHPHGPARPTHVLIVLFDQMRPEYADRFDMTNFKALRGSGRSLPERLPRLHGLGDGDQPQRDRLRAAAEAHGLGGRGLSRHRQPVGRRAEQHADHGRPVDRPVPDARFDRELPQARGLPAREVPGHEVHHGRREVVRGRVREHLERFRDGRRRRHRRAAVGPAVERDRPVPRRLHEPRRPLAVPRRAGTSRRT